MPADIRHWRLLETGSHDGFFNMAVDEMLARSRALQMPVLRVYAWRPHAISLGFHQSPDDLDLARCESDGVDVVRRPTGGRAIYHAHEVTYSVVIPGAHPLYGEKPLEVYNRISSALVNALLRTGVELQLARAQMPDAGFGNYQKRFACFATSAKYEVQSHGKKLVGSAQRRFESALLQHGSIILGTEHLRLLDYLRLADARKVRRARHLLASKTTCLETLLKRQVGYEEIAGVLKSGFETQFEIEFIEDTLTTGELQKVDDFKKHYLELRRIVS